MTCQFIALAMFPAEANQLPLHSNYEQLKVKAAFVLNLARFVEWLNYPDRKKTDDVVMCFYQYNFLYQAIETIRNKKIQNKAIRFKNIDSWKITERCDVILIPATSLDVFLQSNNYEDLQNSITITDLSIELPHVKTLENKIVFRLKRAQARLRFEVNTNAAENLGIKIGSELLKLGILVTDSEVNGKVDSQGKD